MIRKIFLAAILFSGFISAKAQSDSVQIEVPSRPVITGSVDTYIRYNFNDPKSGNTNNYTSFTNSQNSFELGMASIKAEHSIGKVSATIDLGFGRRAEEFSYADPDYSSLFGVKQAYLSYVVSDKVKFTMGKWATHIGYELADAYLNRNYSMSYMFSYGPFSHTGLKADFGLGEKSGVMLGIANVTDVVANAGSRRFALAQFSTATVDDKIAAYINYQGSYGGSYSLSQFDVVLTAAVTDKFSIGYNGTVQSSKPQFAKTGFGQNSWWGSAVYLNLDPTEKFGITLRGEYFDNENGVSAAPATSIFDLTLSPNFKIGNLTIIPELRLDAAKTMIDPLTGSPMIVFEKSDGSPVKSTVTGILAATYHF
ncbi:hypothetical protein BH20BAC1_BH20BAC1_02400 [soil metagenome]